MKKRRKKQKRRNICMYLYKKKKNKSKKFRRREKIWCTCTYYVITHKPDRSSQKLYIVVVEYYATDHTSKPVHFRGPALNKPPHKQKKKKATTTKQQQHTALPANNVKCVRKRLEKFSWMKWKIYTYIPWSSFLGQNPPFILLCILFLFAFLK